MTPDRDAEIFDLAKFIVAAIRINGDVNRVHMNWVDTSGGLDMISVGSAC